MDSDSFDTMMRSREAYHGLTVLPGAWPVLRVDGRSFSAFTAGEGFDKPFDENFKTMMQRTMNHLVKEIGAIYGYVESDEISVLLPRDTDLFHRSVEKLVSISAASATSQFTLGSGKLVQFDSRLWVGATIEDVVAYFSWRQADAARCSLNGWAYWTLRKEGMSARRATAILHRATVSDKNELLFARGINYNDTPLWQRRGIGAYYEMTPHVGHNPVTDEDVTVQRRQLFNNERLPMGNEYRSFIRGIANDNIRET